MVLVKVHIIIITFSEIILANIFLYSYKNSSGRLSIQSNKVFTVIVTSVTCEYVKIMPVKMCQLTWIGIKSFNVLF